MDPIARLDTLLAQDQIDERFYAIHKEFFETYFEAVTVRGEASAETARDLLSQALNHILNALSDPAQFEPFHRSVRKPVDYFRFGMDFWMQAIDRQRSRLIGEDNVERMRQILKAGENVILLGNHQTEPDPQVISMMVEKISQQIADEIIFVAGARVTTDPTAIPYSLGRNLLCIHSKRHLEYPPEQKEAKLRHNQKTMRTMSELLKKGGSCIYVAPSGGRDRRTASGEIEIAPFDPQAVEMFALMAKRAGTPTHFLPLALDTYNLLPPPPTVERTLGERRLVGYTPVGAYFGTPIDWDKSPGAALSDKKERRLATAQWIHGMVEEGYKQLTQ